VIRQENCGRALHREIRVFNGQADIGAFEFFVDGIFTDRFEQP